MSEPGLRLEREGGVARLVLARPDKQNAISSGMWEALAARAGELAADPALRAVIVTGEPPVFSAGADIAELKAAGCVAVTDDGRPVATALLMRRALEYTRMFDMPVIEHCEEQSLKGDGVAHEGFHASALGLRGIPGECESIMAQRDISLAELTGGRCPEHDVPPERRDRGGDGGQVLGRRGVDQALEEVEPHAAHPGAVEAGELELDELDAQAVRRQRHEAERSEQQPRPPASDREHQEQPRRHEEQHVEDALVEAQDFERRA